MNLFRITAGQLKIFLRMARHFPMIRLALIVTMLLLFLEYATLSLMIPLSMGTNLNSDAGIVTIWIAVITFLGLSPSLMTWVWLFLVLLSLRSIVGYAHLCITTLASKQVHRELSKSVFSQVVFDEPMAQIYKRTVGFYISLAGDDTFRAGTLVNSSLQFLAALVSVCAGLLLLFRFSSAAFQTTLVFIVFTGIGVAFCAQVLLRLNSRVVNLSREAGTSFVEALNSLRSIRSMSAEKYVQESHSKQIHEYTRLLFLVDVFKNGIRFVPAIVALTIGIVALAPVNASAFALEATAIFAVTTILIRLFLSLGALINAGGALLMDGRAVTDLGSLIDFHKDAVRTSATFSSCETLAIEYVELSNVNYAYDKEKNVLCDLNLRLIRGYCYSLIGPSGTGKSTLADLLLGLVKPDSGVLRVNGQEIDGERLRGRLILVEQQPRIFSSTVRDNLTLGLKINDAEVLAALCAVEMTSFVEDLPDGLDTLLEYQGANISGGQRQRLSIARALLRRPEILILDEATSALDAATERLVIQSLKRTMKDGVLIFITHDPEVAAVADEVIDLHRSAD